MSLLGELSHVPQYLYYDDAHYDGQNAHDDDHDSRYKEENIGVD